MDKDIRLSINNHCKEFDKYFKTLLHDNLSKNELSKAILYGTLNGGKRLRPFLVSIFSNLAKVPKKNYIRVASAIECIHSYSLIHDDLPSMDNDDFRRGKLSVHKKFNEAQAILAGDSLHDIAFEIISNKKTHSDSKIRIQLIHELAIALGSKGLAGGQSLDIFFENKKTKKSQVLEIYQMKTAALFCYCASAPFIMGNKTPKEIAFAKKYGNLFGLIFQIIDDYLDEVSDFKKIGKTPGKDKKQGKTTLVAYINNKNIIPFCEKLANTFIKKNYKYFMKWKILDKILKSIIYRTF